MKRTRHIQAHDREGDCTIEIQVSVSKTRGLTRDEVNEIARHLADQAMQSIRSAPYMRVAMSEIAVK